MDPLKILAIEHDNEYEIIDKTLREMLEGGSYGQVLTKNSDTKFDATWTNLEGTAVVTGVRNSSYITVSNLNGLTANSIYSLFNSGKNLYIRFDAGKRIELLSATINSADLNITVNLIFGGIVFNNSKAYFGKLLVTGINTTATNFTGTYSEVLLNSISAINDGNGNITLIGG